MWKAAGALLLAMTAHAAAQPADGESKVAAAPSTWTVGVLLGQAASNIKNLGPCPVLDSGMSSSGTCERNPHYGAESTTVAGAYVRYRVLPYLELEADATYIVKGYKNGVDVRNHYIEMPLLASFDPIPASFPVHVFAVGGLAPAVLVNCTASGPIAEDGYNVVDYSGACALPVASMSAAFDQTPSRFDLGLVLGAGIGVRLPVGILDLQWRTTRGLVDVGGWGQQSGKTTTHDTYVAGSFGIGF